MIVRTPVVAPVVAVMMLAVMLTACGSRKGDRSHPAQVRVDAVRGVLASMAGALEAGDAGRMEALWREQERASAGGRIERGFREGTARQVRFTLLGVRVDGDRMEARVTWEGVRDGEAVAGTFMLGLVEGPPVQVVEVSGSDPVSGGAAQVDVTGAGLQ